MPPPIIIPSPSLFADLRELSFKLSKSPSTISAAFQSVELNAQDLETFVSQELPQHLDDTNNANDYNGGTHSVLFHNLQRQVRQLARHAQQTKINNDNNNNNESNSNLVCSDHPHCPVCSPEFIAEIILSLQSVIESTPSLSATVTAQLHSMIGLLRHRKTDQQGAIRSFLRVLWIQSSHNNNTDNNKDDTLRWKMGLTRHRLAMAFASTGNLTDAVRLLEQALSDYNEHQGNASSPNLVKQHKNVVEQAETDWKLAKLLLEQQTQKTQRRRPTMRRSSTTTFVQTRTANGKSVRRSSSA